MSPLFQNANDIHHNKNGSTFLFRRTVLYNSIYPLNIQKSRVFSFTNLSNDLCHVYRLHR
jgi:hypothetical protein